MKFSIRNLFFQKSFIFSAILFIGLFTMSSFFIFLNHQVRLNETQKTYESQLKLDQEEISHELNSIFHLTYGALRSIALLPSIRKIDRHATNFSDDARMTVQAFQCYFLKHRDLRNLFSSRRLQS